MMMYLLTFLNTFCVLNNSEQDKTRRTHRIYFSVISSTQLWEINIAFHLTQAPMTPVWDYVLQCKQTWRPSRSKAVSGLDDGLLTDAWPFLYFHFRFLMTGCCFCSFCRHLFVLVVRVGSRLCFVIAESVFIFFSCYLFRFFILESSVSGICITFFYY